MSAVASFSESESKETISEGKSVKNEEPEPNKVVDTDKNVNLANFYIQQVYDYGEVLKDLVLKKIPTKYGSTPNAP